MPTKSLELKYTIKLIQELSYEINKIEDSIQSIMDSIHSPITSIPRINYRMGAMIIAEIGDFNRLQTATFCGQQGRISRPVRAILSGRL